MGGSQVPSRWQRLRRDRPWVIDAVTALAPVLVTFPGVEVSVDGLAVPSPEWHGFVCTGIACASLAGVRHVPRLVAVVTLACTIALAALGYPLTPLLLTPVMIALAFVVSRTGPRTAIALDTGAIVILLCAAVVTARPDSPLTLEIIGIVAWLLLAAAIGHAARLQLAYTQAAHARAEYAEQTREEEAMRRVASERMRIARDLHDVVSHHLALANAQAGTVLYLMDTDPGTARTMAADLNQTIVAALEDLGTTVGLLRQAEDPDSPLEPAPGLDRLPDLVASLHTAGLQVDLTTDGQSQPLPPGTDLAAYRIIQEALTNVTKHSPAAQAHVRLHYTTDRLDITITDPGGTPPAGATPGSASGSGYGLIGMRERAASLGGRLHAGPLPAGGFEVAAQLPLHPHHPGLATSPDGKETSR
ncbi:sensor histidine kinase [Actinomadura nitritigenes]|uniref:sensor histidine kinase n=1 Tax=Actinomadura nitritigenes TaxID=134602 RepID=UPI003D8D01A2